MITLQADDDHLTYLRLPEENWRSALRYFTLIPLARTSRQIVDLRIPYIALIRPIEKPSKGVKK